MEIFTVVAIIAILVSVLVFRLLGISNLLLCVFCM